MKRRIENVEHQNQPKFAPYVKVGAVSSRWIVKEFLLPKNKLMFNGFSLTGIKPTQNLFVFSILNV
jgi:hypothetical protein